MPSGEYEHDPDISRANGAKGGRPRNAEAHPLFLWEAGERVVAIAWINVRRYSSQGPIDAPRVWPAEELKTDEDLFQLFGGGVYELLGRSSLPNGQPGPVVRRRRLTLEGAPRPFSGEQQMPGYGAQPGPPLSAAGAASGPMDLMLAMMREDRREAREREERRDAELRAAEERREAREAARSESITQLVVGALGVVAPIVQTLISRPAPAPVAPPTPSPVDTLMPLLTGFLGAKMNENPLDQVQKILEVSKQLQPDKPAAETAESLPQLLEGFGHAMGGLAQLEQARVEAAKQGALSPAPIPTEAPPEPTTQSAPPVITTNGAAPPPVQRDGEAASLDSMGVG